MLASICCACVVRVIVTQVRADQHQRRCVTPHLRKRSRDVLRRDGAEHERQQREIVEQHLQERQLNFQAVLLRVRRIGLDDVAALQQQRLQLVDRSRCCPSGVANELAAGTAMPRRYTR